MLRLAWYSAGVAAHLQASKLKTGELQEAVTYGITSLGWDEADAAQLEKLWRGHWAIENRVHYVRDVTMGEDQNSMRTRSAQQVLAALRNTLLSIMRLCGWNSIADALRHYGATVSNAFLLLTTPHHLL